jgi:hypothetical protein
MVIGAKTITSPAHGFRAPATTVFPTATRSRSLAAPARSPFSEPTSRGHNLAYASQREDRLDRLNRKMRKLRTKIGGDNDDVISPFPEEPKGMHWELAAGFGPKELSPTLARRSRLALHPAPRAPPGSSAARQFCCRAVYAPSTCLSTSQTTDLSPECV